MDVAGVMKRLFGFVENMKPAFRLPARLRSTRLRMCFRRARSEPVAKNKTSQYKSVAAVIIIIIIIITPWPFALSPLHSPT